ncbi:chalcone--flavonone isomerase 3 [Pyrus ussuriensis x Pyrus communis]|uniref:Chalcone--flavonone isomerase 3 n=1 Tax=Pyrus ussuriensis x Pyrus communis TaxID=2448454 RepID=A0A5N5G7U0_9ROSA|nr:chalcone--flavonone isomerase 3 [Pyrus ussuriensis x Pyrus communis]
MNNKSQIGSLQETAIDTRAFTKYNLHAPDFTSLETVKRKLHATGMLMTPITLASPIHVSSSCVGMPSPYLQITENQFHSYFLAVATISTLVLTMYNCSAEEEIARWKATAEEEAAVGTGVEQEFAAQLKSIETNFNLMMECRENAGESLLSLSKPANHVAPPVFLRFTGVNPISSLIVLCVACSPAEKFIRVVVTKEIKGSQYGVQIESAARDRLAADDKYEEEEEALEKVLPIKVLQEGFYCVYTLENFGENEQLSKYGDAKSARAIMSVELKKLIEANPLQ